MSGGVFERYTNFGFQSSTGSPAQQGEIAFMRNFHAFSLGGGGFQARGAWRVFWEAWKGGSVVVNLEVSWGNEVQKKLWEKGFCAGF